MARKFCPSCKKLNAGSAATCECGHAFDAASIVIPAAPKICPHCGAGNPQKAHTCHCGRHFDLDITATRNVIVARRTRGVWMFGVGLVALVAVIAWFVAVGVVSFWLLLVPAFVFSNGVRTLVGAHYDLRHHDETYPQLPSATVKRLS